MSLNILIARNLSKGPSEQCPWVQVQQFHRPESSFQGDVDDTEEGASAVQPDDEWVSDFWRHRAIDAVSIHIEGKSACIVAVPVAAQQLAECMDGATPDTDWTRYELTWLSRLLARLTSSALKSHGAWEKLERAWQGELKDADVLHKYDPEEFGGELVYVRACRSVRLAYSTLVQSATSEQEIAHIYCAMGLDKQHHFVQIVLGRFKDLTIGAHFIAAACAQLQATFRAELLSVLESMNVKNRDRAWVFLCWKSRAMTAI